MVNLLAQKLLICKSSRYRATLSLIWSYVLHQLVSTSDVCLFGAEHVSLKRATAKYDNMRAAKL